MEIVLRKAFLYDAETIWEMQKRAFAEMLEKYRDYDTSPAAEPLSKTQNRLSQSSSYYYFICADGAAVGCVRVVDKQNGANKRISPLFILPEYRNRGYATAAVKQAEKLHGEAGWELDTILQETSTCLMYEKLGYKRTGAQKCVNDRLTLVFYKK